MNGKSRLQEQSETICYRDVAETLCYRDVAETICHRDVAEIICYRDVAETEKAGTCEVDQAGTSQMDKVGAGESVWGFGLESVFVSFPTLSGDSVWNLSGVVPEFCQRILPDKP